MENTLLQKTKEEIKILNPYQKGVLTEKVLYNLFLKNNFKKIFWYGALNGFNRHYKNLPCYDFGGIINDNEKKIEVKFIGQGQQTTIFDKQLNIDLLIVYFYKYDTIAFYNMKDFKNKIEKCKYRELNDYKLKLKLNEATIIFKNGN